MALKKQKQLPNGVSGEYWKIIKIEVNKQTLMLSVILDLFLNESQKDKASLNCPKVRSFKCLKEDLQGDLVALSYVKLKAHANSDLPNLNGRGTHKGDLDLVDALDV